MTLLRKKYKKNHKKTHFYKRNSTHKRKSKKKKNKKKKYIKSGGADYRVLGQKMTILRSGVVRKEVIKKLKHLLMELNPEEYNKEIDCRSVTSNNGDEIEGFSEIGYCKNKKDIEEYIDQVETSTEEDLYDIKNIIENYIKRKKLEKLNEKERFNGFNES